MRAIEAAVADPGEGRRDPGVRPARRGDQPAVRRDAEARHDQARPGPARRGRLAHGRGLHPGQAGNIGICIGTSGPAGTDMITGLYSASADSIPILCITGQAPVARLHKEDFQAVDIAAIAAPVTKMAMTVLEPAQVPGAFQQAFHLMRSGPARAGAARPAVRRADGRDRVRHRHLRAAAGLQAAGDPGPGREGAGHAGRGRAAADRGRRRHHQRRRQRAAGRAGRDCSTCRSSRR